MEERLYIQDGPIKRTALKAICLYCKNEFLRRKDAPDGKWKYCSHKCSSTASRKRVKLVCTTCSKEFEKKVSGLVGSKSGLYFCCRKCKDFAQSFRGNCTEIRPNHYREGDGSGYYREWMKDEISKGCEVCSEKMYFKIAVHHKDGDRSNNSLENLAVLCFNCHATRHLVKNNKGEWVLNYKHLTPEDVVREFDSQVSIIQSIK
jgi:hypothetical protein